MSTVYRGVGGAPGVALGNAFRYAPDAPQPTARPADETPAAAFDRFAAAQQAAVARLRALEAGLRAENRDEEADIIDAQALFAEDVAITDEVQRRVRDANEPLEEALNGTIAALAAEFAALDDDYLRERAADIRAVGRLLGNVLHGTSDPFADLAPGSIIVTTDLTPAETASLRGGQVGGFATAHGGPTGHTAILARALGIPAAVGLGDELLTIANDTPLLLDGDNATLTAEPDAATRAAVSQRLAAQATTRTRRHALLHEPGQTADEHPVALWANIGSPEEATLALQQGAEGIGLFRTEFLFLERDTPPDEDEQYTAYRRTLETMGTRPVVIRTVDIGGDKPIPYLNLPTEANPFLGVRGVRLCFAHPELFQTQLRALLRAAAHGTLWVMFPMVATVADITTAREHVQHAAASLHADGIAHGTPAKVGIMIETPAAAIAADLLAPHVDFFSVGSNDLTQYTLAADRGNTALAADYRHNDPAVLRLIDHTARAAHAANIPLGICGELGGDPDSAVALVGMGLAELSMNAGSIPAVKERLRAVTLPEARQHAAHLLRLPSS